MTIYSAGSESRVNTYTTSYQDGSVTTALSGGGYVVAWRSWNQDTDSDGVFLQVYGADGTASGGESQVNTFFTSEQVLPVVAALDTGGFVVAWTSSLQDGDSTGIYQRRYDADGVALGGEVLVNQITTGSQGTPEITTLANGDYVIAWQSDNDDIGLRLFSADGTAITGELAANTDTTNTKIYHDLLALEGGGFVVSWASQGTQDGDNLGIYRQLYDSEGNRIGGETLVNTTTTSAQYIPKMAALADGGHVVTWIDYSSGSADVVLQRYDATGAAQGGEVLVNSFTTGNQERTAITALRDGGYVLAWSSDGQDGDSAGVYLQQFAANGSRVGSEKQVNTETADFQSLPRVLGLADGGYAVAWTSEGQDGDLSGTYLQIYAANGSTVGGETQVNDTGSGGQTIETLELLDDGRFLVTWQQTTVVDNVYVTDVMQKIFTPDNIAPVAVDDSGTLTEGKSRTFDVLANDDDTDGDILTITGTQVTTGHASVQILDSDQLRVTYTGADLDPGETANIVVRYVVSDGQDFAEAKLRLTVTGVQEDIIGTPKADRLNGTSWGENIYGLADDDIIHGRGGNDRISGANGDDLIYGGNGADIIRGNKGQDSISGDAGDDRLYAGEGNDLVHGGAGNDVMHGWAGNDRLRGGTGRDILIGWTGNDSLEGGSGADIFVFNDVSGKDHTTRALGHDTIIDFEITSGDRLKISRDWGFQTVEAILDNTVQDGHDTVITLSRFTSITLENVAKSDLSAGDFILI
ncbi:calcium-binding protein [Rhizobium alvei]|uniref:Ig-like domain-containing protein n=1 Tax=Rhizobium alvei TaxID=1132659 RepID=A0ABT8YPJ7_9HYPH|nr:Ig-like domain-containing protein [Rhizobium alvei]MDO6965227.1 Ig-like domain-containing protein [Rhizobium alvei]